MPDFEILLTALTVVALLGVFLVLWGIRRIRERRILSGCSEAAGGIGLVVVGLLAGAVAANLYTYHRFTSEADVAELHFQQVAEQRYLATLGLPNGQTRELELEGDEWQLDARLLKWRGWATLAGFDPRFRLERLGGRFRELEQARAGPYTVHALDVNPGVDLWSVARRHSGWLPWVDAIYGSAVYMPMAHGARYQVTVSSAGLVVRPANHAARSATAEWD